MTWSVVWTLLPNGFERVAPGTPPNAPKRARLSLVASLRNAGPGTTLGASPLARWPTIVAGLGPLSVVVNTQGAPSKLVPATVVSPAPDQVLWDRLFAPTTPVDAYKDDAPIVTGVTGGAGDGSRAAGSGGGRLVETSYAHGAAALALAGLYEQALRTSPTEALPPGHEVAQAIVGIGAWSARSGGVPGPTGPADRAASSVGTLEASARAVQQAPVSALMDPGSLTNAKLEDAAALLRQQGHLAAAAAAPLAPVLRRLRLSGKPPTPATAAAGRSNGAIKAAARGTGGTGGTGSPPGGPPGTPPAPPSLVSDIRPVEQADFHQVVGLLLDQPALALRLGLRVDLTIPAFEGEASIRIAAAGGQPPQGPVPVTQPFCRVLSTPQINRFVMATEPLAVNEVVNGMLDLRSSTTLTPGRSVVSQVDVLALTQQLHVLSTGLTSAAAGPSNGSAAGGPAAFAAGGSAVDGPGPARAPDDAGLTLPARHDVGFTISKVDRLSGALGQTLAKASAFQQAVAVPPAGPGDRAAGAVPDLFSDDVTSGYRVDISKDGKPFRSLMKRHIVYRVGEARGDGETIEAHDEGLVDPIIPVQQYDQDGNPHLLVGEELFGIDGWSLAAPRPGPKVVAEEAGGPAVAPVEPGPAPGYPLTFQSRAEPGTLTRLRYGSSYSFAARAVDLAGNSIDLEQADRTYITAAQVYRRHEVVPAPVVIPRRVNASGESLLHLVVFSDGDNTILGGPSERHISPPKAPQSLLEAHGLFDEAIGPDNAGRAAARKRLLDLARRESGSYLDPQVPNPDGSGTLVPARGIAVTTNDPVKRPPVSRLPLPRGMALANGEYVIHDTPHVICPFLPDVAAAGAAFKGLTGPGSLDLVDYGPGPWPRLLPFRLEVRATVAATGSANVVADAAGRKVLVVNLPPAAVVKAQLSSTITPAALALMDPVLPAVQQAALNGQVGQFSPRQKLTLVHAVRRPLQPALLTLFGTHLDPQNAPGGSFWPRGRGETRVKVQGLIQPHAASTARVVLKAAWEEVIDRPGRPVATEGRRETLGAFDVRAGQQLLGFGSGSLPSPLPGLGIVPATFPAVDQVLGDQKHRKVRYSVTAATRFREYFLGVPEDHPSLWRDGAEQTVHVLNASRPDPLSVHSIVPIYKWARAVRAGQYVSVRSTSGLRVYLRRPWGTTGVDERLGVLVYDTPATAEANLGRNDPACRLISRYSLDPLEDEANLGVAQLVAENFPARKEVLKTTALLEMGRSRPPSSYGVTVVGHEVKFNAERDLWYADVEVNLSVDRFPFLRLGLVRYQPMSAPGCHVSRVELPDPVQIPPRRTLTAVVAGKAGETLAVTLDGPRLRNTFYTVEHRRPVLDQTLQPPAEITEPSAPAATLTETFQSTTNPNAFVVTGLLTAPLPAAPAPPVVPPAYLKGTVVVREYQKGRNILTGASDSRPLYFEAFDRNLPPGPTLSVSATSVPWKGKVKVTWSGAVGSTTTDWIGVFLPAENNHNHKIYLYTDGKAAGSLEFAMDVIPGTYVFRYLPQDGYQSTATSVPVIVSPPPPSSEA